MTGEAAAVAAPTRDERDRRTATRGPARGRPEPALVAGAVLAAILVLFLALPVAALLGRAIFGEALASVIGERVLLDALALSLVCTLATVVLTVIFGLPLAFFLARRPVPGGPVRGDARRPADRAAAIGGRPRAAHAPRPTWSARCTARSGRSDAPVHDHCRRDRATVRCGAILRPVGPQRLPVRRAGSRGCCAGRWCE